ncbi:MAG: hypothetical protein L0387_44060 [Acidobacteria bacterium]|nr:hypothetical protein [Acidobacteriota bacterium]
MSRDSERWVPADPKEAERTEMSDTIPSDFGCSWEEFIREWCCGGTLGYSPTEVTRVLATIKRLYPADVKRLTSKSARGLGLIAPAVELGRLLLACEGAEGFADVLARLQKGERAAYSEFVVVSSLARLGHTVRFAVPLAGRVLDLGCVVKGVSVYFEVVTPERSDASAQEQHSADQLTATMKKQVSGCRVEIEIRTGMNAGDIIAIAKAVQAAPPSEWVLVGSLARVRRIDFGKALPPMFDGDGAQIVVGGERHLQGESTSVIARWESSDARAKRVFNEEYHHFAEGLPNVLVVEATAIPEGMQAWPTQMARLLQPGRNRRVGAVAFFEGGLLGPPEAIRRRWRVLMNPHAHVQVPEALLSGIESLDESSWYGLPRPERLVAA